MLPKKGLATGENLRVRAGALAPVCLSDKEGLIYQISDRWGAKIQLARRCRATPDSLTGHCTSPLTVMCTGCFMEGITHSKLTPEGGRCEEWH